MNKFVKIFCCALSCLLITASFAACDRGSEGQEPVNKNRTQLRVGVFDGGLGSTWIYDIKDKFEEKYKDVSFEAGKKGVQIRPIPSRAFTQTGMEQSMDSFNEHVIFAEGANFSYFANKGNFLDISDVVTKPLSYDFVTETTDSNAAETATIESKMRDAQKEYYSSVNGKYYAIPSSETFCCLIYDIELFEENNLFFGSDGNFVTGATAQRSNGPDGRAETEYDNGLPVDYDQFFRLCDKILSLNKNYIPVMWGGNVQEYVSSFLTAMAADYAGIEQTELNYNFDGQMKGRITSFDSDGNPVISTDPVDINASNGYLLYQQPGKYYSLKFLERLTSNKLYYNNKTATSSAFTHKDAEGQFVIGKYRSSIQRAAMLIDGNWWQSEAAPVFNELVAEKGEEASIRQRKFGVIPFPKANGETGEMTLLQNTGFISFINANVPENLAGVAKAFLQYCYTDEAMRQYTLTTNVCRPLKYDMGDKYEQLGPWGKQMADFHKNAKIAYMDSASKIMQNYSVDLWYPPLLWLSKTGKKTYTYPSTAMIQDSVGAKNYFEGMSAYWTESVWKNKFRNV